MIALQKKPLSSPDLIRRSIAFRKLRFFQMDARVRPAHDGVGAS
jgi:hypothetical protein